MQELIAPRPLRLAPTPFGGSIVSSHQRRISSPFAKYSSPPISEAFARIKLAADDSEQPLEPSSSDDRAASPLGLEPTRFNAEALEEFLSILRPSVLLSSASPIARIRRAGQHSASSSLSLPSGSAGSPSYERPHPYKVVRRDTSRSASSSASDDGPAASADSASKRARSRSERELDASDLDTWHASVLLGSPISRSHTMNPLPRDPCYESMTQNMTFRFSSRTPSPSLLLTSPALSPATREHDDMETAL